MKQLWLLLILTACSSPPPPKPVLPGADYCDAAADRIEVLQCKDRAGRPLWVTPKGRKFGEICREALADGRDWQPLCLAKMPSCSDMDRAYRANPCPF